MRKPSSIFLTHIFFVASIFVLGLLLAPYNFYVRIDNAFRHLSNASLSQENALAEAVYTALQNVERYLIL